jgi:hypothetical protein
MEAVAMRGDGREGTNAAEVYNARRTNALNKPMIGSRPDRAIAVEILVHSSTSVMLKPLRSGCLKIESGIALSFVRHCEERKRRSNPELSHAPNGLLRGACHRAALCADPVARNDARARIRAARRLLRPAMSPSRCA